jgi:hypothetical protein
MRECVHKGATKEKGTLAQFRGVCKREELLVWLPTAFSGVRRTTGETAGTERIDFLRGTRTRIALPSGLSILTATLSEGGLSLRFTSTSEL